MLYHWQKHLTPCTERILHITFIRITPKPLVVIAFCNGLHQPININLMRYIQFVTVVNYLYEDWITSPLLIESPKLKTRLIIL